MTNTTQQTIEERLELTRDKLKTINHQLTLAQVEKERLEKSLKKREELTNSFKYLIQKSDFENKRNAQKGRFGYQGNGFVMLGSCADAYFTVKDPVLIALTELRDYSGEFGIKCRSFFKDWTEIRETISKYHTALWLRTGISEVEYLSLLEGTEPVIGKYLKRVYSRSEERRERIKRILKME